MAESDTDTGAATNLGRRRFLEATGAVTAAGVLLDRVEATESVPRVGETHLVDLTLEHEGIDDADAYGGGGDPRHVVDADAGLVTVGTGRVETFRSDFLAGFRGRYAADGARLAPRAKRSLVTADHFDRRHTGTVLVDGTYTPPRFAVTRTGGGVVVRSGDREQRVPAGGTASLELPERRVETAGRGTVTVTPVVGARNNGRLDVYGRPGARVLPIDADDPRVQNLVRHYVTAAEVEDAVSVSRTDRFLVVEIGN